MKNKTGVKYTQTEIDTMVKELILKYRKVLGKIQPQKIKISDLGSVVASAGWGQIELNRVFLKLCSKKELINTLKHEIVHCSRGCRFHNFIFIKRLKNIGGVIDWYPCESCVYEMISYLQLGAVYNNGRIKVIFRKKPKSLFFPTHICSQGEVPGYLFSLRGQRNIDLGYVAKRMGITQKLLKKIEQAPNVRNLFQNKIAKRIQEKPEVRHTENNIYNMERELIFKYRKILGNIEPRKIKILDIGPFDSIGGSKYIIFNNRFLKKWNRNKIIDILKHEMVHYSHPGLHDLIFMKRLKKMGGTVDSFTCERYLDEMRLCGQLGAVYKKGRIKVIFRKKPKSRSFAAHIFDNGNISGSIYQLMREKNGLSLEYVAKKMNLTKNLVKKIEATSYIRDLFLKNKTLKRKFTEVFFGKYFACVNKLNYAMVKRQHEIARKSC